MKLIEIEEIEFGLIEDYQFFLERGMEAGPASGRTIYEAGDPEKMDKEEKYMVYHLMGKYLRAIGEEESGVEMERKAAKIYEENQEKIHSFITNLDQVTKEKYFQ